MEKRVFRKILAIALASAMLAGTGMTTAGSLAGTGISVNAAEVFMSESGKCGENVVYTLDSEGTLTISGYGAMYDYPCEPEDELIPDAFNGSEYLILDNPNEDPPIIYEDNNVLYYYDNPFYNNENIKKVMIEDGVNYIGIGAFRNCKNMISITIADTIEAIGSEAFVGCESLADVRFPSTLEKIDDYTFWLCAGLKEINIPESVVYISPSAFLECADFTIYGEENSYAQSYAEENDIPFVSNSRALENNSEISENEIFFGQTVTVHAKADGGKGNYTYDVLYKKKSDTKWTVKQDYAVNDTVSIKPAKATDYDICVKVKDQKGSIVKKFFTVKVNEPDTLENNSSVNFGTIGVKKYLKIYGSASGGIGDYTYAYLYKKQADTKWSVKKNYSDTQEVTLAPQTVTTYNICVKVKDGTGTIVKKFIDVKVNSELASKSKVSSKSITKGQKVTMTGAASGGSGSYTYAYLYRRDNGAWSVYKNYSTANSVVITPASSGTYEICIKAKDSYGTIVKSYFTVNVKELLNKSTLGKTEAKTGETVKINGSASGGNGSYSYAYYLQEPASSSWKTLKDFSATKAVEFKVDKIGKYNICVKVKDITGIVAKKYLELEVFDGTNVAAEITARIINNSMSSVDKIKAIHDWLVNNTEYDTEGYASGNISSDSYTAEGLFKTGRAVCDGYAKAFQQMAESAGFEVIKVNGIGVNSSGTTETHAWNQVKVDGKWYNIDVTWDDPVTNGEIGFDNLRYKYFLVPDSVIANDHIADLGQQLNKCTTAQPMNQIINNVIEEDIENHDNYFYCASYKELSSTANSIAGEHQKEFTVIYKTANMPDVQKVMNTVLYAHDDIMSLNIEYMDWKFDGYTQMTFYLVF